MTPTLAQIGVDGSTIRFGIEIMIGAVGSLVACFIFILKLTHDLRREREKERAARDADMAALRAELQAMRVDEERARNDLAGRVSQDLRDSYNKRFSDQNARMIKLEHRLEEGDKFMSRLEERLEHLPTQRDVTEMQLAIGRMSQQMDALSRQMSLINETLMREREDNSAQLNRLKTEGQA